MLVCDVSFSRLDSSVSTKLNLLHIDLEATGIFAQCISLSFFFHVKNTRVSDYFWTVSLRPMAVYSALAVLMLYHLSLFDLESCGKCHLPNVESKCCLMKTGNGHMNNRLNTILFTIGFMNQSDCDHCSKYCNLASSAFPELKNLISIVFKNCRDDDLIPFKATILSSCGISTVVSWFEVILLFEFIPYKCHQLPLHLCFWFCI